MKKIYLMLLICCCTGVIAAQELVIKNDKIRRVLQFDGKRWRTTRFQSADGRVTLKVQSDEWHILPMDSDAGLTVADFTAAAAPKQYQVKDTSFCTISYRPEAAALKNDACPQQLLITYFAVKGQPFIRKKLELRFNKPATIDRLEVERFVNGDAQSGGGRGEPVFIKDQWFTGLEYPAGYSRRSNGNLPASYGRYYDSVGNYSFIDLEGRDVEPHAQEGMVRLMHFPGYAVPTGTRYAVQSKTAVTGYARSGADVRQAFMQYLETIWKKPRSFVNYNNWFDRSAKDLKGDAFVNVYKKYKAAIEPYGIRIDGMVPDDGWQDRYSIWKPAPKHFPEGDPDLVALSNKLKAEGTHLGLWLSVNNYNGNIDWGIKNGYSEAKRNAYFSRYGRYYSLSATKYKTEILQRVPELAKKADLIYFKHDFNDLCDMGPGNNHPPTDRHGHEANLDVALQVLTATREARPGIFQNLTNWIWFSPWWLQYADYLWMLAGDDGMNGNTPELSLKAMFTTDRDTYIWRMFGNAADRPLVPVSRLMTHGILQTAPKEKDISLQDWTDYVLMHYGRGTLLKEWYISLDAMRPELWAALSAVQKWADRHQAALNHTVFVGGRPDEGHAYGYMGWDQNKGILTARNTGPGEQTLRIPFNKETGFYGLPGAAYHARVTYPYQEALAQTFASGKEITIRIPGYATLAVEFEKGAAVAGRPSVPQAIRFQTVPVDAASVKTTVTLPADIQGRCELLVIGHPRLPSVTINGQAVEPQKTAQARLNHFASYAVAGMKSNKASDWNMAGYNLMPYLNKTIEITCSGAKEKFDLYILTEKEEAMRSMQSKNELLPANKGTRRQTTKLY
ncbi:hypothetical protein LQ567_00615 [Niabella pedocola]|uniref:Alpha-N-acetylgalactosaminidase n=1 Tax=Niabella pedocola TaxID=1752077 RepID=A0ABS8PJG6_9BACT|nr:hypothetical protein [Niabella pedocola]MCD2421244.1 hypothetical protein [Niabella pedocola]